MFSGSRMGCLQSDTLDVRGVRFLAGTANEACAAADRGSHSKTSKVTDVPKLCSQIQD